MNKSFKSIIRDARAQVLAVLLLLWIATIVKDFSWQAVVYPLYSVLFLIALDLGFTFLKTQKWYYPFSSAVSGLLIGFLIHYSQGIIILTVAVLLAFISKQFLKFKHRHIFNPAAFGTVLSTMIFGSNVSWWATASGGISLVFILPVIYVLYKLRRLQYPIFFLVGYFLFFTIINGINAASSLTLDGTVFLFSFIMLTEPMGSSITKFWKWGFGPVVLAGVIISYFLKISFADPLLLPLLFANLLVRITTK
ncbi:hypothetical protein HY029_02605 [Candidatus Gottesmanbacteria bacterium]|nr:hypothetical protein [Candidatus Gottesmanbacteria bacterium]